MPTRREFLQYAGGATAGLLLSDTVEAQRREVFVGGKRVRTIDAHTHCFVGAAYPIVRDQKWMDPGSLRTLARVYKGEPVISAKRLADEDKSGTDTQVLNIPPWWYPADNEKMARAVCAAQNKGIAAAVAAHPDRFLGYACVSLQFPEVAAEELQDTVKQYKFVGAGISCNVNGEELAAARFDPFWKKAQELNVPIFLHPGDRGGFDGKRYPEGFNERLAGKGNFFNVIGHPLETSIALAHLIYEGTFDRFPGLKIIAAHAGGFIASYIERFDAACVFDPKACRPGQRKPSEYFKTQIFCDSKNFSTEALRHLVAEYGASQIVFGTDHPANWPVGGVDQILNCPITDDEKIAILGGNLSKMLRLDT